MCEGVWKIGEGALGCGTAAVEESGAVEFGLVDLARCWPELVLVVERIVWGSACNSWGSNALALSNSRCLKPMVCHAARPYC